MTTASGTRAERPSSVGRRCTKSGCQSNAVATLTYIYADSTAVLGPLSTFVEPHAYDLCVSHSEKLTVPMGWTVIQHKLSNSSDTPSTEDVLAIAEAIRQTAKIDLQPKKMTPEVGRRGHLRSIPKQE